MIAPLPQGATKTQTELMFEVPTTARISTNEKKITKTKNHAMITAFIAAGLRGLNRFQAYREHHDSVLNSTISVLQRKYFVYFSRELESVPNFTGGTTRVMRYWLDDENMEKAIKAIQGLGVVDV